MSASCATYLLVVPPTPLLVVLWFAQQHTGLSLYEQFLPRVRVTTSCTSTEGEGATVWHGVGWARTAACLSALATALRLHLCSRCLLTLIHKRASKNEGQSTPFPSHKGAKP